MSKLNFYETGLLAPANIVREFGSIYIHQTIKGPITYRQSKFPNGNAWILADQTKPIPPGGGETLAQTLVLGNATGGNDILISTAFGDSIVYVNGAGTKSLSLVANPVLGNFTQTFQDASGTIALTSDITATLYNGDGTVGAGRTATLTDYIAFNGGEFRTENGYWQGTSKILYINPNGTTDNLFVGQSSGNNTTTGLRNTAFGSNSLTSNTSGNNNTSLGYNTLYFNTIGNENTAIGNNALHSNISGYYNTSIGNVSLASSQTGINNVAIGWSALSTSTQANDNVAIGYRAMALATTAYYTGNVAIGSSALLNTSTSNQVAVGYRALTNNTTGSSNTAIGHQTLDANTTGGNNSSLGYQSLFSNTIGNANVAIGYQSLYTNDSGISNMAIGHQSLFSNTTGSGNTTMGYQVASSNTTGSGNTVVGYQGMGFNTTGSQNTVIGREALYSNSTGSSNVALGLQAGYYETGSNKLFIDNTARANEADGRAKALVYGIFDAAVANQKLYINANEGKFGQINIYSDTSLNNFHWNSTTMPSIPSGSRNTLIGNNDTGTLGLTTGANNFLGGAFTSVNLTAGARNILIGTYSTPNLIDGNDNIFFGNSNTTVTNVAQSLAFNGEVRANNQVVFGDPDRARYSSFYFGQGIDTPDAYGKFDVNFFATSNQTGETDKAATVTNFIINGSQGTGTGAGGAIVFKTAPAGLTGSTPNALVTAMTIKQNGQINMSSLPVAAAGLVAGDIWNNGGVLTIV